ncbi:MAG: molybdate ABC transporter permease subunit [Gammaproteobacteria bacterium]|nr:molybdate ABC transporter permease subunit [Gammaproteobacteria bacterium]
MIDPSDLLALWTTLKLALISTLVLLAISVPLAWWLATSKSKVSSVVEVLVALPLVLPPTVLGFYLLLLMRPDSPIGGAFYSITGERLVFSFSGLIVGSVIYSLPFVVQPIQNAFVAIGRQPMESAATLGASRIDAFFTVALPLAKPGVFTAAILGFAHTVGEFGVVLMIGGNIPGETRVASIAIYDHVESLNYARAHNLAGFLLVIAFVLLMVAYSGNRKVRIWR